MNNLHPVPRPDGEVSSLQQLLGELFVLVGQINDDDVEDQLRRVVASVESTLPRPTDVVPVYEQAGERPTDVTSTCPAHSATDGRNMLAQAWVHAVVSTSFVPGGRVGARVVLEESLQRLAAALVAEPFDPVPGYRVGSELVAARIASPRALGNTLTLLDQRLIPWLGITHWQARARLSVLLGQLATGFAEAVGNVAFAAVAELTRHELAVWRDRHKELSHRLERALLSERLTGLPNRVRLDNRLSEILTDPPSCERLGVCLINLDRFKAVNDSLGHNKGDWLLHAVAQRLRQMAHDAGHFVAHLGADEFAIVVENTSDADDMAKVADLVLRTLRDPFNLDGHYIPVAASAGIVERAADHADPAELLRTAGVALGWAKVSHRGNWVFFDESRYAGELHRHALTAAMPAALNGGEFRLAYQPLVRLADRGIVGVEALARWRHPVHGAIGPAQFIPQAESTGLIVPLGLHLLEEACIQAACWRGRTRSPFLLSVNLAATQLRSPGFAAAVTAILDRTGLPADQLQFEITESVIVNTGKINLESLHKLAHNGVRLAIDEFGTGYSCLAYLSDLPVNAVKLAPGFLRGLDDPGAKRSNSTILSALITLSHSLGLTVTAKGVETAAQAQQLATMHCDFGQGFHFGHPTTTQNITQILVRSTD